MKSATFDIEGMRCEGCARTIEALIRTDSGVAAATASFHERRLRVLFDPRRTAEEELAKTIEQAGFRVAGPGS